MHTARPIRLDFKGRMHAPSKPVGRGAKAIPVRPAKRTGYFGYVTRGLERYAQRVELARDAAEIRARREINRPSPFGL